MRLIESIRNLAGRSALDWHHGAGRLPAGRPRSIDIIIPVFGAPAALRACLESVSKETELTRHRVLLVADGPQEPAVESVIADFTAVHPSACVVLRNEARLGFAASVNRGMSASTADVVLLNSDTIVTPGWVGKLIDAACSSGDVGTVTPLSNHATLCSVPRAFEENLLPAGLDAAAFGSLIESVSARDYPRLPTGVGVCLYIRRALLDDVGLFDARHFGRGYGEENDFCMRALKRGWLHIADDATFIEHAGHRSFGASRTGLQRRARTMMGRLHPRYMATVAAFMRADPLAPVRLRITSALEGKARQSLGIELSDRGTRLAAGSRLKVVHLVHGWPPFQQGGTELYARWLVREQRKRHEAAVYARAVDPARGDGDAVELTDEGVRVRLVTNNFTARNPLRRNALSDRRLERDFERFLKNERPDLLHIHHLAGHAFSLAPVARRLGIPIVLQIQDWWLLCARVNLLDREGNRCSGPAAGKCARCATLTRIAPAILTNRLLHRRRRSAARAAIRACDAFVAGSRAIRDDFERAGVLPPAKAVHVIPYGVGIAAPVAKRAPARTPLRFGYVGAIAPHKGIHVAVEAMRDLDPSEATLHVWGDATAFPDYMDALAREANGSAVIFEGRFPEDEKPRVFSSMDALLVPSVGLESFGLAAREAMTCGVPVIASAGGALSEMFAPGVAGDFFPAADAAALRRILRRVVADPSILDRWSAQIPTPKRSDVHALEINALYATVLAGSRAP